MIGSIVGAAALVTFVSPPAFAAGEKFEMTLNSSRTALETPAGAVHEYRLIAKDIHDRCAAESASTPFSQDVAVRYCERRTMNSLVRALHHPNFAAVHKVSIANRT